MAASKAPAARSQIARTRRDESDRRNRDGPSGLNLIVINTPLEMFLSSLSQGVVFTHHDWLTFPCPLVCMFV